jgi:VCBS repeat-containing protein
VTTDEDAAKAIVLVATDVDTATALTYAIVTGPAHGTLTGTAPNVTYTPAANYNGADSFTFKANDGTFDSNVGTISITVHPVNDAPVATDDSYSTDEDTTLAFAAAGVRANDDDVDNATLTAVPTSGPSHGTLALNADGSFAYTPDANYHGPDSFTYTASDGTLNSNAATVSIAVGPVNDVPLASDRSVATDEDVAKPIALAASDADGDALTYSVFTAPTHGSLSGDAPNLTYTPAANYHGSDSFTFKAGDGALASDVATVSIVVGSINDAPVAADDSYSVDEDTPLSIAARGVLENDGDVEGDSLAVALVDDVTHGALALNTDGSFAYTPDANFDGTDRFSYNVSDGAADSNVATVSIVVRAVNDAPHALDDVYTIDEETALEIAVPGVLGNDEDVDDTALTAALVSDVAHGTLTLNADGSFTYTPGADFNSDDSFSYQVGDGALASNVASVTIAVDSVNDAPVADDQAVTTGAGTPKAIVLTASDVDNSALTYNIVAGPAHGSLSGSAPNLTYTPNAGYSGPDSFTFKANDGAANSNVAAVAITVNPPTIVYNFSGFFQPVDNLPTFNSVNAGRAIPVKFSLGGDFGLDIFAAGYPASQRIACDTTAPVDPVEETSTAGSSSLSYDPLSGRYHYVWKTEKAWAGTCRQLIVRFNDGSPDRIVYFKFDR